MDVSGPVLLFDGECGLCVRCVKFLLWADGRRRLHFAPLQGETAQAFLRKRGFPTEDFSSVLFIPDWARRREVLPLKKTDALLSALAALTGFWRLWSGLRFIPRAWRDAAYNYVARRRRRFFGPAKGAPLWTDAERQRFLL